jgi:hypothetical protein
MLQAVRWISIVGIDLNVIMALATKFKIHHLMVRLPYPIYMYTALVIFLCFIKSFQNLASKLAYGSQIYHNQLIMNPLTHRSSNFSMAQVEDVIGSRLERPKLEVVGDVKHILLSSIFVDSHGALQKCRVRTGNIQN